MTSPGIYYRHPQTFVKGEREALRLSRPLVVAWLASKSLRGHTGGSVLAQEGPAELKFPAQIFIGYIDCSYGAHEHLGGAFANFGSQVGFLCSDCAESDRIDYHALTSDHVRLMAHACVTSSSIAPTSRRFQP